MLYLCLQVTIYSPTNISMILYCRLTAAVGGIMSQKNRIWSRKFHYDRFASTSTLPRSTFVGLLKGRCPVGSLLCIDTDRSHTRVIFVPWPAIPHFSSSYFYSIVCNKNYYLFYGSTKYLHVCKSLFSLSGSSCHGQGFLPRCTARPWASARI